MTGRKFWLFGMTAKSKGYNFRVKESVPGREVEKYLWIANELRYQIASGQLPPGSQLPQREELEETFKVSKVTLQRAMNLLIDDGFVDATRRKGSFVSENPPHLNRYVLVFQKKPVGDQGWLRFWTALTNEANRLEEAGICRFVTYYGVDGETDSEDYRRLERDVREHRLAGVIYVAAAHVDVPELPILREFNLPRVTVKAKPHPDWPAVVIETDSFIRRALDYLASRGRKRIAFITPPRIAEEHFDFLQEQTVQRGMSTEIFWLQGINLATPALARNCVHLLMHSGQSSRPDGLIIADDNLVEHATSGLVAAGVRVPSDIEVVAHANFPWVTTSIVSARRLGCDVPAIIRYALDCMQRQRAGETIAPVTEAAPLFEDEVGTN